ncbi:hypothetical protein LCGC14_1972010, partial [marine sediment metagenome]
MKELSDEQLAVEMPKAFPALFPRHWMHSWGGGSALKGVFWCGKCDVKYDNADDMLAAGGFSGCPVPSDDPIVIDWNVAMMVFRAIDKHWAKKALVKIFVASKSNVGFGWWLMYIATPADYLRAALLAKGA